MEDVGLTDFKARFTGGSRGAVYRVRFPMDELPRSLRGSLCPGDALTWMTGMRSLGPDGSERFSRFLPHRITGPRVTREMQRAVEADVHERSWLLEGSD